MHTLRNPFVSKKQEFIGFADQVAVLLGGTGVPNSSGWCQCLCPAHSDRNASLSLRDSAFGLVAKCFSGCKATEIRQAIVAIQRTGAVLPAPAPPPPFQAPADTGAWARQIWLSGAPADGSLADTYLRGRSLTARPLPGSLRFHGHLLYRPTGAHHPALIASVVNLAGDPIGVHRIWLHPDGRSYVDKWSLGKVAGGAVRLAGGGNALAVGEGVESTLSYMQLSGLPGWAALTAPGLANVDIPSFYRTVIIATDNDHSGVGQAAAERLRQRLLREGRSVRIVQPETVGADFNDVLRGLAT